MTSIDIARRSSGRLIVRKAARDEGAGERNDGGIPFYAPLRCRCIGTGTNSPAKLHGGADGRSGSFAYGERLFRLIESSHLISRITERDARARERP